MSTSPPDRPSWDETRIRQALILAERSLCSRAKVGAIITDLSGRIVGEGLNGPPKGFKHELKPCSIWCRRALPPPEGEENSSLSLEYDDCYAVHAEADALLNSDRERRQGGTIFVTSHICFGCAKLIASSGLARVYVSTSGRADAHRNPVASYQFLADTGLIINIDDQVMMSRIRGTNA